MYEVEIILMWIKRDVAVHTFVTNDEYSTFVFNTHLMVNTHLIL